MPSVQQSVQPKNQKATFRVLLVFLLFLAIISIMQFRVNEIIGFDGWLHIKMADIIRKRGFIKEFPYTSESILAENYADIQLLFRVLLIPFTYLGLMYGAKIASIFFASLCFTFFYWYLKKNDIAFPLFWTSLYSVSSLDLMYRFLLPRAMPLAILFLVLTFYFMDKRMYKSLLVASLLFVWLYPGFVFQLAVIVVYFVIDGFININVNINVNTNALDNKDKKIGLIELIRRQFDFKLLFYPFIGALTALVLHPYFPNNITLLYTQLFRVNLTGNAYNAEWRQWNIKEFFKFNCLLLSLFIIGFVLAVRTAISTKKLNKKSLLFFVLSAVFFIAMLKTRRMHEYFAPFTVLFAAFSLNNSLLPGNALNTLIPSLSSNIRWWRALRYVFVLLIIIIAVFSLIRLDTEIKNNHFLPWYKEGAEWLRKNAPKNSKIFINGYTFNYLFFYSPEFRYTHGIDLTYSYIHSPERFERYMGVLQGRDPGYNIIKTDYNADYALVGKIKQDIRLFNYIVKYKEDFEVVYEDESVGILKVRR